MFSVNASVAFEPISAIASQYDVTKSARNTKIEDVHPLAIAKSKDDGSPNFTAHPYAAGVFLQGFTLVCIENENQAQHASSFTWMKWMKRQQRTNFLFDACSALRRL